MFVYFGEYLVYDVGGECEWEGLDGDFLYLWGDGFFGVFVCDLEIGDGDECGGDV